jgi:two-component system CheB/CheR fusion protein
MIGMEPFGQRVKIYATDLDDDALTEARHAAYRAAQVESVPMALRDKYFDFVNDRYTVKLELRRAVIFGRHDLLLDAPISRIDLLSCRNTLMYFNAEAQARILSRFEFALNPGGFLFLGKAEVMLTRNPVFVPVDARRRILKARQAPPRLACAATRCWTRRATTSGGRRKTASARPSHGGGSGGPGVLDLAGNLVVTNAQARESDWPQLTCANACRTCELTGRWIACRGRASSGGGLFLQEE